MFAIKMKRPVGITILATLNLIGGVAILAMQVVLAVRMTDAIEGVGISPIQAHVALAFLGALGLVAGVGMLLGRRWGWWLGAFYLTYSVARNTNALISLPDLAEQFGVPPEKAVTHFVKFGGRVIIHSLLCWYFFTPKVEAYFQVGAVGRWKRLAALVGATIAVLGAFLVSSLALQ